VVSAKLGEEATTDFTDETYHPEVKALIAPVPISHLIKSKPRNTILCVASHPTSSLNQSQGLPVCQPRMMGKMFNVLTEGASG
jgi:hypothetical protein